MFGGDASQAIDSAALSKQLAKRSPAACYRARGLGAVRKKSRGTRGAARPDDVERRDARRGLFDGSKRPNVDALCSKLVEALKSDTQAGGGVDDQTADQLALCMAFASGPSRLRLPKPSCRHLETVMHFAARFTGAAYELTGEGESVVLACTPKT